MSTTICYQLHFHQQFIYIFTTSKLNLLIIIMLFWKLLLFLVSSLDHSSDDEQHRINQASLLAALPADHSPLSLKKSTRPKKCPGCKQFLHSHQFGPASRLCQGHSSTVLGDNTDFSEDSSPTRPKAKGTKSKKANSNTLLLLTLRWLSQSPIFLR